MINHDFTFAWEDVPDGPWSHLQIIRLSGVEAISTLYRYELVLLAGDEAAELNPRDLIGKRVTLRIATLTEPAYKVVHGIIVDALEGASVPEGMLYHEVLMPPLERAAHRRRCRIFLEKTIRQIIDAVLQGDPALEFKREATVTPDDGDFRSFTPAVERYTWRILDLSRIDDVRARPFCVQYNESDFAFLSRILEDEGISYHFENGAGVCLLVLSDSDHGKVRLDPFDPLGLERNGREISTVRLGARLRQNAVRLRDFDWRKPALDLVTEAKGQGDLVEYRYPGEFHDDPALGEPLAKARLERLGVEADYATGDGRCRVLSAGAIFRLEHAKSRYEGEYLVTRLEVHGEQRGAVSLPSAAARQPWTMTLECARRGQGASVEPSRYRPERVTPKPRIFGTQTAFVTAEPRTRGAEIHVGGPPGAEIGCVRVLFHWDKDSERHASEPASCWVRVSQAYAGAGEGALCHPRVGNEVIVQFVDGDPDRPIIIGRVYNGLNRPSAPASGAATVSTFKTCSSPGGAKLNELSFDDTAGREAIKLHAGKNWNSEIGHDRTESVANNSSSSVDVDRAESTGGNRSTAVRGNNAESVDGRETITIGGDQALTVGASRIAIVGVNETSSVGADQSLSVGANRSVSVGGNQSESVQGNAAQSIAGSKTASVAGSSDESVMGSRSVTVAGTMTHTVAGAVMQTIGADLAVSTAANTDIQTGANLALLAGAQAVLQGASVMVNGDEIVLAAGGSAIKISGAGVAITGAAVTVAGGGVDVAGGNVKVN